MYQVRARFLKQRVGLYKLFVVCARHDQLSCPHCLRHMPSGNLQRAAIAPSLSRMQPQHLYQPEPFVSLQHVSG